MSATATLLAPEDAPVWVSHFRDGQQLALPPIQDDASGRKVVHDLKILKAGKFKDSLGRPVDMKAADLAKMVENFNLLRDSGIFPDVPVRADHSISVNAVLGYFTAMRSDGTFLYADVEFTEPDAAAKYARGTYRSRSIEIGPYETNGDKPQKYYPVVTGLAFVDIPAVEGLYRRGQEHTGDTPVELHTFSIRGVPTTDYTAVERHLAELESAAAKPPTPHTFRVNGAEVTDYAKVQEHIATLESQRTETLEAGRIAFVAKLIEDNKLAAPQKDATVAFVKTLSADQYGAWKAAQENAPAMSTFAQHAGSGNGGTGQTTGDTEEIEADKELVQMHRFGGMTDEQVEKTAAFQRLKARGVVV